MVVEPARRVGGGNNPDTREPLAIGAAPRPLDRERPHPGAQLDAFEEADGWRYTAFATDTRFGQLAHLDARHRAHARVEDRSARRRTPA